MNESYTECGQTFNEVMFVPQYSEIEHRGEDIDTSTDMGKFRLNLPIVSANMKDITGTKMAAKMAMMGGLGILHRFGSGTIQERIKSSINDFVETVSILTENGYYENNNHNPFHIGVSVGVQEDDYIRFEELYGAGARLFTVDVAHGHHILVKKILSHMRMFAGDKICIIAGNVATVEGAEDLYTWGADIIKVGIGPGAVCITRKNTGVGVPQLKAIRNINREMPHIPIISDGGIKDYGDIPKALKYANAVMVGSLIAGTSETPGHVYQNDQGEYYKVYGGSASGERKVENGGSNAFVEGVVKIVPFKGKVKYILRKAQDSIQSSMSYSGAENMEIFRKKSILADISSGARQESKI